MEGDLLVPGLAVGADHDLPVRDLGQDPEAEPERLLNQSPGAWGRESWPRSMVGTARSQKMPFTIGAACRSMALATAKAMGAGVSTSAGPQALAVEAAGYSGRPGQPSR